MARIPFVFAVLTLAVGAIAGCPGTPGVVEREAVIRASLAPHAASSRGPTAGQSGAAEPTTPPAGSTPARSAAPLPVVRPSAGDAPTAKGSFDPAAKGVVGTYAGIGQAGDADGNGLAAAFDTPRGVAVDARGVVYVSEFAGHRLRAISTERDVSLLAGAAQSGSANGAPTRARFNNPMGIAVDAKGLTLAVADYYNNRVRRLTRTLGGAWTVSTMTSRDDSDQSERPGQSAELWYPTAVAVDAWGRVLVADSYNDRVRVLQVGGDITTLTAGTLLGPGGIAVDAKGAVYIADTRHHRICKLTPPSPTPDASDAPAPEASAAPSPPPLTGVWTLTVLAGSGQSGRVDGGGATARFSEPRGLAVDKAGAVYVADAGNHCIRKIVTGAAGLATVSTVAGGSAGYVDGPLSKARFDTPTAVAIDPQGRVYVADSENHVIRRIQ